MVARVRVVSLLVAHVLEQRDEARRVESVAGHREVRAEAEAARLVTVRVVERTGRGGVVLELGRRVASQRADHSGDDHGEPVRAGVHDARLAQDG